MDRRSSGRLFGELLKIEDMGNIRDPECICRLWEKPQLFVAREKRCKTFLHLQLGSWLISHTSSFLASTDLHSGIESTISVFLWQSRILWLHIHNVDFIWKRGQIGHAAQVYLPQPVTEQSTTLKGEEWGNLWEHGHRMGCKHLPQEKGFAGSMGHFHKHEDKHVWNMGWLKREK